MLCGLHRPGFEPRSTAWKAAILPLDYQCLHSNMVRGFNKNLVEGGRYLGGMEGLGSFLASINRLTVRE